MKIVVIGGTGLIGTKLVTRLRERGHEAVPASPRTGVDTMTGKGLAEAFEDTSVVVDVSNSPSFETAAVLDFFRTSTGNLLSAEADAGVRHHVALSVVGTQRLSASGYFRAKIAQEELIRGSSVPYSIVHATQFFEFARGIADASAEGDTVRLAPVFIQPMASDDVAAAVAEAALAEPTRATVEVAGPERFRLHEFVQQALTAYGDGRTVVTDPHAPYFGARLEESTLLPAEGARLGGIRFADWLERSATAGR